MSLKINIVLGANTVHFDRSIAKSTKQAQDKLQGLAGFAKKAFDKIGLVGSLVGSGTLYSLQQTADQMQDLASKVKLATSSTDEYNAVQNQLRQIANEQKSSFAGVVDLYTSSSRALSALGKSQQQTIDFTRNLTMAMKAGGGSAQAQAAALTQLGQALGSGALRGDEFNSVAEQAPVLLDLVAKQMGVSTAALRDLAKQGKITSDVVYDAVVNATDSLGQMSAKMPTTISQGLQVIKNSYDFLVHDIVNEMSGLGEKVGQALAFVGENFRTLATIATAASVALLGSYAKSVLVAKLGADSLTASIAKNIISLKTTVQSTVATAYSLDNLTATQARATAAITGFVASTRASIASGVAYTRQLMTINGAKSVMAGATARVTASVIACGNAMRAGTAAAIGYTRSLVTATAAKRAFVGTATLAARSVGAIGSAFKSLAGLIARHPLMIIGGIIAAIVVRTMGLQKAMDSLSDAIKIVGLMLGDLVDAGINAFMGLYNAASNFLSGFLGKSEQTTEAVNTAFGGLFANTKGGFVGVLQVAARIFDRMVNAGISAVNGLYRAFVRLWNGLKQGFAAAFGAVTSAVANGINAVLDTVDGAISGVNKMIATAAEAARGFGLDVKTPQINKIGYRANGMVINVSKTAETDIISARSNFEASVLAYADQVAKTNKANADLGKAAAAATTANNDAAKSAKGKANADKKGANAAKERSKQDNAAATAAKKLADSYNSIAGNLQKQLWELGNNPLGLETGKVEYELTQGELRGLGAEKAENALKLANFVDQASIKSDLERNAFEAKLALLDTDFEKFFTRMYGGAGLDKLSSLGYEAGYNATTGNAQVVMTEAGRQERFNALLEMATLEADKLSKSYADNNRELNNQLALLGVRDTYAKEMLQIEQSVNDELAKYRSMDKDNELGEQYSRIKEAAEQNAELQKQLATMTAYREITDNLATDEQKRSTELMSQLDILNKQSQIAGRFDIKTAEQLIGNAIGSAGTASTPFDELIAKKNEANELLKQANDTLLANERLTAEERINIEKWVADEQLKIKKAHNLAMGELVLAQAAETTAQLADGLKQSLGEQSKAYRAAFVLQQSFAIGSAVLNMHKAISDAFAEGTTFAQKLAGIAAATTQGMKIVTAIRQIQNPVIGQAHDGIMSVPKSGTWNLEKGERVLPKHTAKNLDKTLASVQGRGNTVNVSVTVNSSGGDVQADSQMGKRFGEAIQLAVQAELQKERRQGGLLYGR
ncbi:tape measure domain-containing protein [Moraxella cuniculi DSM 21768]|uniref:Tape measure domain-containing protein n=1 Tax=Moraxella cuniculi DSM 21768 TaxID=1122245 RepID=A0A1N7G475_9GAMM|nr:tape measure protein [Moraxella cuniculi]SIS07362.1 tape measure domain-containing protein [Moraxella cuniculi DSM 21768]